MKTALATLFATALFASPALACGFGASAEMKHDTQTAKAETVKTEQAMSTYDPATKPLFETATTEATDPVVELETEE